MPDIYVRGVSEDHKRSLAMLAASLDISLNTLCMWILEEAAMPYDELRQALNERAAEVHAATHVTEEVSPSLLPSPKHPTRHIKVPRLK